MTVVTRTDRPKSIRNRCVIEVFLGVLCYPLVFEISVNIRVFVLGLSQIFFFSEPLDKCSIIIISMIFDLQFDLTKKNIQPDNSHLYIVNFASRQPCLYFRYSKEDWMAVLIFTEIGQNTVTDSEM